MTTAAPLQLRWRHETLLVGLVSIFLSFSVQLASSGTEGLQHCASFHADIFDGVDREAFWEDWQERPMFWHSGFGLPSDEDFEDRHAVLFGVEEALQLAEAVAPGLGLSDVLEFVRTGSHHDPKCGLSPRAAYARGCTLVVPRAEMRHPFLARLALALAPQLGRYAQLNLYVTPPGGQGFMPHFDTMDILVVQLSGAKHWLVHGRQMRNPVGLHESFASDEYRLFKTDTVSVEIPAFRPGDVLYIPRGWVHQAFASTTSARSSDVRFCGGGGCGGGRGDGIGDDTCGGGEEGEEIFEHSIHITVTLPTEATSVLVTVKTLLQAGLLPNFDPRFGQAVYEQVVQLCEHPDEFWAREALPAHMENPEELAFGIELVQEALVEAARKLTRSEASSAFRHAITSVEPAALQRAIRLAIAATHVGENARISELENTSLVFDACPSLRTAIGHPRLGNSDDIAELRRLPSPVVRHFLGDFLTSLT